MKMTFWKLAGMAIFAATALGVGPARAGTSLSYGGRTLYVHVPSRLPA